MSSLAVIASAPQTPEEWQTWAFTHMASHLDIVRVTQQLFGTRFDIFPLNPIDFSSDVWTYNHVVMHQQMDAALGIAGYDLTGVAWDDRESLLDFINFNYIEHSIAQQFLGL